MSHAISIERTGGPEVLRFDTIADNEPEAREVRVRHTAIGVNFIDTYHRSGLYPLPALPSGIGSEAAGVVESVGRDVQDFQPGDRVAYATGLVGAYAERRCIDAKFLVPLPSDISDETAAAVLLKGMTVEYLIRRVHRVSRGETVLWHAAAGGVGLIACQWLSHLGATVIGTVSTEKKARLAAQHGCAHPVLYTSEDFRPRVRAITAGEGVPVVYDSVGKSTLADSLDCLQRRGLYVGFGNASGKPEPFDLSILAQKGSLYITRPTLAAYTATRAELLDSAQALFDVVRAGHVKAVIGQRFRLSEARQAHEALHARETAGSTLLIP